MLQRSLSARSSLPIPVRSGSSPRMRCNSPQPAVPTPSSARSVRLVCTPTARVVCTPTATASRGACTPMRPTATQVVVTPTASFTTYTQSTTPRRRDAPASPSVRLPPRRAGTPSLPAWVHPTSLPPPPPMPPCHHSTGPSVVVSIVAPAPSSLPLPAMPCMPPPGAVIATPVYPMATSTSSSYQPYPFEPSVSCRVTVGGLTSPSRRIRVESRALTPSRGGHQKSSPGRPQSAMRCCQSPLRTHDPSTSADADPPFTVGAPATVGTPGVNVPTWLALSFPAAVAAGLVGPPTSKGKSSRCVSPMGVCTPSAPGPLHVPELTRPFTPLNASPSTTASMASVATAALSGGSAGSSRSK